MKLFHYRIHNINIVLLFLITVILLLLALSFSIDVWFTDWSGYALPQAFLSRVNMIIRFWGFPVILACLALLWIPKCNANILLLGLVVYFLILANSFPFYGLLVSAIYTVIIGIIIAYTYWRASK